MAIEVSQLVDAIVQELKDYTNGVVVLTDQIAKTNAKKGVLMLKNSYATRRTGEYNSGWKMKKAKGKYTIYNAKKGYLTHILQNGYAKASGGRVEGIPHISVVEQQVIANFEAELRREIEAMRQ